jgi:hypothetical protein
MDVTTSMINLGVDIVNIEIFRKIAKRITVRRVNLVCCKSYLLIMIVLFV